MKKIKIDYIGFWSDFDKENNFFSKIFKKYFEVEIAQDGKPDFLLVAPNCDYYEYVNYDCVRILYAGEPFSPDFNQFDYAVGFDDISFGDRYYRYPLFLQDDRTGKGLSYEEAKRIYDQKEHFCNFIYGHPSKLGAREKLLELLSQYKRVDSVGRYLNNMQDYSVPVRNSEKIDFIRKSKFTIACDSVSYPGFTTEKLTDAMDGDSIPIYAGNPDVAKEFNTKSFINCADYDSWEDVVNRVIELDNNEEEYIKMLMEPKYVEDGYHQRKNRELEEFFVHIFSQEPEKARRRHSDYCAKWQEDYLRDMINLRKTKGFKWINRINKYIK